MVDADAVRIDDDDTITKVVGAGSSFDSQFGHRWTGADPQGTQGGQR